MYYFEKGDSLLFVFYKKYIFYFNIILIIVSNILRFFLIRYVFYLIRFQVTLNNYEIIFIYNLCNQFILKELFT